MRRPAAERVGAVADLYFSLVLADDVGFRLMSG